MRKGTHSNFQISASHSSNKHYLGTEQQPLLVQCTPIIKTLQEFGELIQLIGVELTAKFILKRLA